ncbi:MAG TPA: sugar-transporting ATPase [Verrucomicrobiales bacterium]|nr:sugar-transporting ATPase [Verrucomicrobiales bacterium]
MKRLLSDYGMVLVLLALCVFFSAITYTEQHPAGESGGRELARQIIDQADPGATVLIAARAHEEDRLFAEALRNALAAGGITVVEVINGEPSDARRALQSLQQSGTRLDWIAGNQVTAGWLVFADLGTDFPALGNPRLIHPESYHWPNFLKRDNLLNISNQIAVIAILAIGMTMVIITAGIDLSVGSLIALSAVVTSWSIVNLAGAQAAGATGMLLGCLVGIGVSGLVGLFSGAMVTKFRIPPFIVTLAMMLVASGIAYLIAQGQSIYQVPDSFVWLGRGADLFGIPNAVVLMVALYVAAHFLMSRMKMGRYLYAVGGNPEAARLSGVPVNRVLLFAYAASGVLAGLGGVVMASQLRSGSPTYGQMYELYTIAAVVVGGTSLAGGEGKMFGTLIGAFIIAVIQNGMNLKGVEPYTQRVVLGLVILIAVLLDRLRQRMLRQSKN